MEINQYYTIAEAGEEARKLAKGLLQAYPVTRACLSILGSKLIEQLEFGFFTGGEDIIHQGKTGKELYLLCNNTVDVLVNEQVVVQMQAPVLLGDKAIVEPKSTRSATIRIAKNNTCLFIKIPMGLFLRDFKDTKIPDIRFSQETGIFYNMFEGIQKRLFEYIYLQKNLWEEVTTTLNLLNTQLLAKILDNQKPEKWGDSAWNGIKDVILKEFRFTWPDQVPTNTQNCRKIMYQILDTRFPRNKFPGSDQEYVTKKSQMWRKWLTLIGSALIKIIPKEKLPVFIGDVELFNPRNYQLRTQGLLRKVEKNFSTKVKSMEPPKIGSFFGQGENANTFNLNGYLLSFEKNFAVKHTKRTQAQIAQRTALVAAKCENEFNNSVAGMQKFLEKVQKMSIDLSQIQTVGKVDSLQLTQDISTISKGFVSHNRKHEGYIQGSVGKISYVPKVFPTSQELVKASGSKSIRIEINKSAKNLFLALNLSRGILSEKLMHSRFYFCEASPGFTVPPKALAKDLWIPISTGITLVRGDNELCAAQPGRIFGGRNWRVVIPTNVRDESQSCHLKIPDRKPEDPLDLMFLMIVIPQEELPWERTKNPHVEEIQKVFWPMMQWRINQYLDHLLVNMQERDSHFEQGQKVQKLIHMETQLKLFETKEVSIPPREKVHVAKLCYDIVNLKVSSSDMDESNSLSKKIYNHILTQMKDTWPNLRVEERSNKAYTKWRYVLNEIVQIMDRSMNSQSSTTEHPQPVVEVLSSNIEGIIQLQVGPEAVKFVKILADNPQLDINGMLSSVSLNMADQVSLFNRISEEMEDSLLQIIEERKKYIDLYEKISASRPTTDDSELEMKVITEMSEKLTAVLGQRYESLQI
ncbi:MAG: cyclic nucleotide-binding domain-containing protein [Proteobacteria bacterium]|nr:cyclic nucleotide-binding domain-containing protein [Pseudomonadota bacterium]